MKTVGVGEIKALFPDILEQVKGGDRIAIAYSKKKKKIAMVVPYGEYHPHAQRKLGLLQGKAGFEILPGLEITDDDLLIS